MWYNTRFFASLAATFLIEIPLLFVFIGFIFKEKAVKAARIMAAGLVASGLTLPYLWFIMPLVINNRYMILLGELFAVLAETVVYRVALPINMRKSFVLAAFLNTLSFLLGNLIIKSL